MTAKLPPIRVGDRLFLGDGAGAFGAVRGVGSSGRPELLVNVEGHGDASISLDAVEKVVAGRVVVRFDALSPELQRAVKHVTDREDFPPRDEGEVDIEPVTDESEDEDDRSLFSEPPESRPDELPGRAEGSRYGAPPSVAGKTDK